LAVVPVVEQVPPILVPQLAPTAAPMQMPP